MLTSTDYLYEVLFRFSKDGTIAGAHRKDLTVIKNGDTVLSESESTAKPIAGADIEALLGEICTAQCATIDQQVIEIQTLTQSLADIQAELDALTV
jgi:hypothetical protein